MITKEFNELKKLLKIENANAISRIHGCYVDADKNKVSKVDEVFLNLPEEEQHKYLELLKKGLSGSVGKNLISLKFEDDNCEQKKSLLALRDSNLKNEDILDAFYDEVIANLSYVGNYLILLADQSYDVPAKTKDNMAMEDVSTEVYHYVICVICPVELSTAGLEYYQAENIFRNAERTFMVKQPAMGFLYPSFNDRAEDRHCVELYSKNSKSFDHGFIQGILGCVIPTSADKQKTIFTESICEAYDDCCTYDVVENISKTLADVKNSDNTESEVLTERGLENILKVSGVEDDKVDRFKEIFNEKLKENEVEDKEININNIIPKKHFEYEVNGLTIKADDVQNAFIDIKEVDGRLSLVIEISEDIKVNGIKVKK